MAFGVFEAAITSDQEVGLARQASVDKLAAATYDVREKLGPALFASRSVEEFRDRVAMMKRDQSVYKIIDAHLHPSSGIVRRIVGKGGSLEKEFKARLAAGGQVAPSDQMAPPTPTQVPWDPGTAGTGENNTETGRPLTSRRYWAGAAQGDESQDNFEDRTTITDKQKEGVAEGDPNKVKDVETNSGDGSDADGDDDSRDRERDYPDSPTRDDDKREAALIARIAAGDDDPHRETLHTEQTFKPKTNRPELKPKGNWQGYLNSVDQGAPGKVKKNFANRHYADIPGAMGTPEPEVTTGGSTPYTNVGPDIPTPSGGSLPGVGKPTQGVPSINGRGASRLSWNLYTDWCGVYGKSPLRLSSLDIYAENLSDSEYLRLSNTIQSWEGEHHPKVPGTDLNEKDKVAGFLDSVDRGIDTLDRGMSGAADKIWNHTPRKLQDHMMNKVQPGASQTRKDNEAWEANKPTHEDWQKAFPDTDFGSSHRAGLKYLAWCQRHNLRPANTQNLRYYAINAPMSAQGVRYTAACLRRAVTAVRRYADDRDPTQIAHMNGPEGPFSHDMSAEGMAGCPLCKSGRKGSLIRQAAPDYLQKADDALTQLLNTKAEEFQQTIAPLQQALMTVQQAEQLQQQQNPLNVLPPPGSVNVMPGGGAGGGPSTAQQVGMPDPNSPDMAGLAQMLAQPGGGGAQAGLGAPPGEGMPDDQSGPPPAAAGGGLPPDIDPSQRAAHLRQAIQTYPGSMDDYLNHVKTENAYDRQLYERRKQDKAHEQFGGAVPETHEWSKAYDRYTPKSRQANPGKGRGATRSRQAAPVTDLWNKWQQQKVQKGGLPMGGEPDYEEFANTYKVGPRALQKLKTQHSQGGVTVGSRRRAEQMTGPFAGYENFGDCEEKNSDKGDTGKYCGEIHNQVQKGRERKGEPLHDHQDKESRRRYLAWCRRHRLKAASTSNLYWYAAQVGPQAQRALLAGPSGTDDFYTYNDRGQGQPRGPQRRNGWELNEGAPTEEWHKGPHHIVHNDGSRGHEPGWYAGHQNGEYSGPHPSREHAQIAAESLGLRNGQRKQAWSGWGPAVFPKARKVAGWEWDNHLNGYIANRPQKFACECGSQIDTPSGFKRCACGKQWNSYVIGTGGNNREAAAEKFLVREIPQRIEGNVIVANRQLEACWPGCHENEAHAKKFHNKDKEASVQLVDPRTGNIHNLIDPGELDEGQDSNHSTFNKPPPDWARRGQGGKWLPSAIG